MNPAQVILDRHRKSARYLAGIDAGRWAETKYEFPHIYVRVVGRDPETGTSFTSDYHLLCDDYPAVGPFVERWDSGGGLRSPAPSTGAPGYIDALKEWSESSGVHGGIYRAWQRGAAGHNAWASKRTDEAWRPDRDITFIMEHLYALNTDQACWLAAAASAETGL
jgi:hypothetical protein